MGRSKHDVYQIIETFRTSETKDQVVTLIPAKEAQREIRKQHPDIDIIPLRIRLIKYTAADNSYCLGTTLMDAQIMPDDFKAVYHARWGIEELYKVSKQLIGVDDFHGKSERTVKQELYAHFVLITMSRLCTNESENILSGLLEPIDRKDEAPAKIQVNFKNCLATVSRHLEEILMV